MKSASSSYKDTKNQGFTVGDLAADPSLDTTVVAGHDGLGRTLLWAHVCELGDPARWLGPHELVMTMGSNVPSGSQQQREFIARLDDAGLAGMSLGEPVRSPRYTKAMRAEADKRGFPILHTGPDTPFAAIGRAAAYANADRQTVHLMQLSRLYRLASTEDRESRRTGRGLLGIFGTRISVVDDATDCIVIGEHVTGANLPGHPYRQRLRTRRRAHVVIEDRARLDAFSLVHLTQVLEVEANAIVQDAERDLQQRQRVFEAWLNDRDLAETQRALEDLWGRRSPYYRVIASDTPNPDRLHLAMALSGVPVLTLDQPGCVVTTCRDSDLAHVRSVLRDVGTRNGVSTRHIRIEESGLAVAEATSTLQSLYQGEVDDWQEFQPDQVSLMARSRREARTLIESVLGPLAGDDERATGLRATLFAFLDHDLRWGDTAANLGIHRQTLTYRMEQVERSTGRDVRVTKDIAELWLARTAWAQFEGTT
jgi:purine catabolism regulator